MDNFRIEPTQQAGAQQFWKRRKHAVVDRLEMHRERPKRRRQSDVQADRATRTAGCCGLQRTDFGAADRRTKNHHGGSVETAALDQIANRKIDTGAETLTVAAQPDAAGRRGIVHSAAVLSPTPSDVTGSTRLTLCSATK